MCAPVHPIPLGMCQCAPVHPITFAGLRLAVEIHIGGHKDHPYFEKYTLPDLLLLRSRLRAKGCKCNLVSLLRHPLLQHLSWHYHFCNHRVPLCFWNNPPDCQVCFYLTITQADAIDILIRVVAPLRNLAQYGQSSLSKSCRPVSSSHHIVS